MKRLPSLLILVILSTLLPLSTAPHAANNAAVSAIQAPVLKWAYGGCSAGGWCQTGWYSSPAVGDIDGDHQAEVIGAAYDIYVLNGDDGSIEWQVDSGHDLSQPDASDVGRTWPGVALGDIDGDGDLEIATAHGGGWVAVYNAQGYFEPGWPQRPTTYELRGLALSDLDQDGTLEVIVTGGVSTDEAVEYIPNTWVFEHDGSLRPGWPQLNNTSGYDWGVFNDNLAVGNLYGDGRGELVVPSDVHYICAYDDHGTMLPAHSMYGGKAWGRVGIWESLDIELRGWGRCNGDRAESYRTNFAHGPAVIADVNGDRNMEVIATGNVYDCAGSYDSRYTGVYIFNADRSRFTAGGFDWQTPPVDTGAPIQENYWVIENAQSNPAVADLDGDGQMEIIFASYDGRLHAFWLDKTEHGSWPYSVYHASEGFFRFASEPAIADLDNDGQAEVIFASWTQIESNRVGMLHILSSLGDPLYELPLPAPSNDEDWNGALPAPTLANIDGDSDLEVVLNTAHSGLVAYDLPGTANARLLWSTGRGSYWRDAYIPLKPFVVAERLFMPLIQK
ncbi:MAG TPA: VCBS repeat-containing protein [Anaerolineales bacterium]|nr:VCBS repeat-containing protein [Anaerolineales bacterium]